MKIPLVLKANNNFYLYSLKKKQLLLISSILGKIIQLYINENLHSNNLEYNDFLKVKSKNTTLEEFDYYYNKFIFLKENGFLECIEDKLAEITPKKIEKLHKNVKYIAFDITEECNLACKYCIYNDIYEGHKNTRKKHKMKISTAKEIIDSSFNNIKNPERIDKCGISFYGGEPLLNFSFIQEIVEHIETNWRNVPVDFYMTTNGLLLNNYSEFLVLNKFNLLISLDGDKKHNKYRVFPNGQQSFDLVQSNISKLKTKFPEYFKNYVTFNTVLHSQNKNEIEEIDAFFYNNYSKKSILGEINDNEINPDKKDEFLEIYGNEIKNRENNLPIYKTFCYKQLKDYATLIKNHMVPENSDPYFLNSSCLPCEVKMFVANDGSILPCEKVGDRFALCNFYKDKMQFNYKNIAKKYSEYRELSMKKCKTCYKIDCAECIYRIDFDKKNNCKRFINKHDFKNKLVDQILEFEKNLTVKSSQKK